MTLDIITISQQLFTKLHSCTCTKSCVWWDNKQLNKLSHHVQSSTAAVKWESLSQWCIFTIQLLQPGKGVPSLEYDCGEETSLTGTYIYNQRNDLFLYCSFQTMQTCMHIQMFYYAPGDN